MSGARAAMSDGLALSTISGAFLEKVASNERLSRDLPRKGRDAKREAGSAREPAPPPPPDAPGPEQDTPVHIDLRI